MTDMLLLLRGGALLAGLPTVLGMLSLSAAAQTPARSAFDILEVGRWSNPPKKVNPLAAHPTCHTAAMNCEGSRSIVWMIESLTAGPVASSSMVQSESPSALSSGLCWF